MTFARLSGRNGGCSQIDASRPDFPATALGDLVKFAPLVSLAAVGTVARTTVRPAAFPVMTRELSFCRLKRPFEFTGWAGGTSSVLELVHYEHT